MAKNDTTTRFNADISELKAAFQEASRQIKLANSEFKAASSGMEDWNQSADGVTAKLSQLDKVLDAQEKQLKSLNDQYELTVKEYGENSAAAENLKIKINNQQAAINATKQQINSYNQQLQNMQSQAQKSESAAEKLRNEIKNQEKNLSDLKDKYASVVLEQGRESDEAKALANQIGSLSGSLNDNRDKLKDVESAANEFDSTIKKTTETAEESKSASEKLRDEIKNQEKNLSDLKDKYASVVLEQGRESDEAKALANQIGSLSGSLNDNRDKLKDVESAANEFDKSVNKANETAEESKSASEKLRDEIKNQEKNLSDLKDKYASVVLEQGRESDEAKALANQINNLSDNLNDNRNKLENAESAADEFDNTLSDMNETSDKSNDFFSSMKESLVNLVTQGLQLAIDKVKEFATEAVNVGKDFDSAMSKVKATSGASAEDMNLLRDKAKEMGSETKFSATESAEALNYMAMAGWKTNDMLDGISGIMNLAAASGEELALTSDIVTDALTALGMSANESGHFADVLASASSNANTNVSLMGESFKYVAPVAGAMGASAEDLAIALGLMANSGIKGSQSGNSLKNSLVNLIRPTAQQAQAMANLGLATIQTRQVFDDDTIAKAQTKLENKTLDLEKAQLKYNESISKYGIESSQAQQALINVEKAENNLADAERDLATARQGTTEVMGVGQSVFTDEYGNMKSLSEIINILRDTFKAVNVDLTDAEGNMRDYDDIINELSQTEEGLTQAEQLKNAGIIFGKQNLAGMLAIINSTKEDYDKLSDAIYNCDGKAKEMADTMSDNLGGDMTKFQSQLESLKIAFYEKFVDSLREGVKSLGKLIDAGYWILDHGTEISAVIAGIAAAFVAFKAVTFIQSAITAFQALATVIQAVGVKQAILNAIMAANPIGLLIAAIAGLTAAFFVLFDDWEDFQQAFQDGMDIIVGFFKDSWNNLKLALIAVIAYFISLWDGFKDSVVAGWQMIGDFFVNLWNNLKLTLIAVIAYFISLWDGFKDSVVAGWQMIGDFFVNSWEGIKAIFALAADWFNETIIIPVSTFFSSMWDNLVTGATLAWEGIKTVFSVITEWFGNKFTEAWTAVKAVFSVGGQIFDGIKEGITSAFKTVVNAIIRGINKVVSIPFNAINRVLDRLRNLSIMDIQPFGWLSDISVPKIPELREGGVLRKGKIGFLEGDGDEAVVPLEKNTRWIDEVSARISRNINTPNQYNSSVDSHAVTNNFYQTNNSPKALSRLEIYRQSKNLMKTLG